MTDKQTAFWRNLLIAAETDVRDASTIRGGSGIDHPVVAVGVDDTRKRVVVISGDADARSAALAQSDIQAALGSVQVVVARPIVMNLADAAKALTTVAGGPNFDISKLQLLTDKEQVEAVDLPGDFRTS